MFRPTRASTLQLGLLGALLPTLPTLLAGCSSSSPQGEPTAPTADVAPSSAPTASGPAPDTASPTTPGPGAASPGPTATPGANGDRKTPAALVGRWTSPRCGERTYVRNVELLASGRFEAEDRVSPCPPNVDCVWSGIVVRKGVWYVEGDVVKLATDKDRSPPRQGASFGGPFAFANGGLVEVQGSERCTYTRP